MPPATNAHRNARNRGKIWEREVAKAFGTKRTGPTGMNDADIVHDLLGIECKAYGRLALREADLQQMEKNAAGRVPILALKEFRTGRKLIVSPFDYFVQVHIDLGVIQ